MRFGTFARNDQVRWGVTQQDAIYLAPATKDWPRSLLDVIELDLPRALELGQRLIDGAGEQQPAAAERYLAPIPRPRRNVFCLGLNYADHAAESARAAGRTVRTPDDPIVFTKATTTVNGPYDDVVCDPAVTQQLDWEVELGLVIGRAMRAVSVENALNHVFGYCVVNDLSARDVQSRHKQFFLGKSLDGSCPLGPTLVSRDEIDDPQTLKLTCDVNGERMQDGTTADQIFGVAETLSRISHIMTLEPGDIFATGTPAGVGLGRNPPRYLSPGDVVECSVERVGTIRNRIVAAKA